jgi:hypothetical protein
MSVIPIKYVYTNIGVKSAKKSIKKSRKNPLEYIAIKFDT